MDAKTVQKPSPKALSPPLIPPLGDDWLATDCLSLKLTIRNYKKAPPGGLSDCFDIHLTSIHNFSAVIRKKYFSSKEVPPFHLGGVMSVIVNTLGEVELGWN